MEINRSNIKEIVDKSNAKPDKDYGQNFLIEPQICEKIVNLISSTNFNVLEIGPGLGSLTHFLVQKFSKVTSVDIDERMVAFLKLIYKDSNFTLIQNDIRKEDLSGYKSIIGNLPYNITKEILIHCLTSAVDCNEFIFMIQKEAACHVLSLSGKDYGPLSIYLHLIGDVKKELTVKAGCFYPTPKCDSIVFSLRTNKELEERIKALAVYNFSKKCFINRRKTLMNNLMTSGYEKEQILTAFKMFNLNLTTRPEEVDYRLYTNLMKVLN